MAKIPFFGIAVHAVFLHLETLQKQGARYDRVEFNSVFPFYLEAMLLRSKDLGIRDQFGVKRILDHYRYHPLHRIRVKLAWHSIAKEAESADEVRYEPRMPNGRRPDMVLRNGLLIRVVDVETYSETVVVDDAEIALRHKRKHDQIVSSAKTLARTAPAGMVVAGYRWTFQSDADLPARPEWHLMCRLEAGGAPAA